MVYTEKDRQYKRYTITSALPYANGPVHIGHLAGVYVPADVYARYRRDKADVSTTTRQRRETATAPARIILPMRVW